MEGKANPGQRRINGHAGCTRHVNKTERHPGQLASLPIAPHQAGDGGSGQSTAWHAVIDKFKILSCCGKVTVGIGSETLRIAIVRARRI